jgi:hypothetical protein
MEQALTSHPESIMKLHLSAIGPSRQFLSRIEMSEIRGWSQPVDATQALNLSAGVSNCKVSRGRSLS